MKVGLIGTGAIAHKHADSYKEIGYEQDSGDVDLETRNINRICSELLEALQMEDLNRVGYRRKYLIPTAGVSLDELVWSLAISCCAVQAG